MSDENMGRLQNFTIDQAAGATALVLGSIGGLLMVIWKSRCLCKCRLGLSDKCYLFDCERRPPPVDPQAPGEAEEEGENHVSEESTDEEAILPKSPKTPKPPPPPSEPEPEPEPEPVRSASITGISGPTGA